MKKVIEVRELVPAPGKEYMADGYPGLGLYKVPAGWALVYQSPSSVPCVMLIGSGFVPPFPMEDYKEPEPQTAILNQNNGISAADLLKAIAISQNPLLAKELLK